MIKLLLLFSIANLLISLFIAMPNRIGDKWKITPYTNTALKTTIVLGFLWLITN